MSNEQAQESASFPNGDAEAKASGHFPASSADDSASQEAHAGVLDRFPEAVGAAEDDDGAPRPTPGAAGWAYRVLLYGGMVVGTVAALALVAAVVLQAWLAGSYISAGGNYLGSEIEGVAARELLSLPVGGFVLVVVLALAAICAGAYGMNRQRSAARPATEPESAADQH